MTSRSTRHGLRLAVERGREACGIVASTGFFPFARWDLVHWAPGVRRVLSADGSPSVVADGVIDRLRLRLAAPMTARRHVRFTTGQPVVIERGPLAMVDAIFDRDLNTSERVQVLVRLLGRSMPVVVDAAILRPAG